MADVVPSKPRKFTKKIFGDGIYKEKSVLLDSFTQNVELIVMKQSLILAGWLIFGGLAFPAEEGLLSHRSQSTMTPAHDQKTTIDQLLDEYRFDEAIDLLQKEIAQDKRKKRPTEEKEAQLHRAQVAAGMLSATEKVTFIDSLVVDSNQFMKYYRINPDVGQIGSYGQLFPKNELHVKRSGKTVFINELGDLSYISLPNDDGELKISRSEKVAGEWETPIPLSGLSDYVGNQDFPFVMADGVTLYYAAKDDEGLGGYDIYVTRYNADSERFVKPENVGMPFNSPANDYLYAIDEFNNLGWFVTDRNQPAGKVCIYIFIPNSSREVYNETADNADELRNAARITSIAASQKDAHAVAIAKAALAKALSEQPENDSQTTFRFVLDDSHIYTSPKQFTHPQAQILGQQWSTANTHLKQEKRQLEQLRQQYARSQENQRKSLTPELLRIEKEVEQLETTIDQQALQIRKLELSKQ